MGLRQLADFEYLAPKNLKEACSFLKEHGDKARVMAGGTDLLVGMKQRIMRPQVVIGLKSLPDLDSISYRDGQGVSLGALATHRSIVDHPSLRRDFGGLWTACSKIGTPQVRNMGTVGGNLCNAAPSADTAPPLIASQAALKLAGLEETRTLPMEDFFVGPGRTALRPGEILVEIDVPRPPSRSALVYHKLPARSAVDIAAVGVAVFLALAPGKETCEEVRIALGAVGPTPLRARSAEGVLRGERLTDQAIEKAAQMASADARPISDVRASAAYRSEMVKVLTREAVKQAFRQAKSA